MEPFNYKCPFCNVQTTIVESNFSESVHGLTFNTNGQKIGLLTRVILCPNPSCKEMKISAHLCYIMPGYSTYFHDNTKEFIENWVVRPKSTYITFPEYIPKPILADYEEACQIMDISPKASATLFRRCLQGMIRDFWGISKKNLFNEIEALEEKVDAATWNGIDAIRKIGNIGAHMEKDINTIIDVDPDEAKLLRELIEILIKEWYIHKYERDQRLSKLTKIANGKEQAKKITPPPII